MKLATAIVNLLRQADLAGSSHRAEVRNGEPENRYMWSSVYRQTSSEGYPLLHPRGERRPLVEPPKLSAFTYLLLAALPESISPPHGSPRIKQGRTRSHTPFCLQ